MRYGFTLIELTIVLTIIGLLTGGILAGQSLINSVQISGVIRDLSHYQSLIRLFKTKYNQLPGDSTLFIPNGDNNGIIEESGLVWNHLSQGMGLKNFKGNHYKPNENDNIADKTYYPTLKINQRLEAPGWKMTPYLGVRRKGNGVNNSKTVVMIYRVALASKTGNVQRFDPLLSNDTAALDKKLDDDKPSTGIMTVYSSSLSPALCTVDDLNYNIGYTDDYICSFTLELSPQP